MSVIIRLQGLSWSASAMDIRNFFKGLNIPPGGVRIIGGDKGDAFIAFSTDEDARQAMMLNNTHLNDGPVQLFLSSKTEMQNTISQAKDAVVPAAPQTVAPPVTTPVLSQIPSVQQISQAFPAVGQLIDSLGLGQQSLQMNQFQSGFNSSSKPSSVSASSGFMNTIPMTMQATHKTSLLDTNSKRYETELPGEYSVGGNQPTGRMKPNQQGQFGLGDNGSQFRMQPVNPMQMANQQFPLQHRQQVGNLNQNTPMQRPPPLMSSVGRPQFPQNQMWGSDPHQRMNDMHDFNQNNPFQNRQHGIDVGNFPGPAKRLEPEPSIVQDTFQGTVFPPNSRHSSDENASKLKRSRFNQIETSTQQMPASTVTVNADQERPTVTNSSPAQKSSVTYSNKQNVPLSNVRDEFGRNIPVRDLKANEPRNLNEKTNDNSLKDSSRRNSKDRERSRERSSRHDSPRDRDRRERGRRDDDDRRYRRDRDRDRRRDRDNYRSDRDRNKDSKDADRKNSPASDSGRKTRKRSLSPSSKNKNENEKKQVNRTDNLSSTNANKVNVTTTSSTKVGNSVSTNSEDVVRSRIVTPLFPVVTSSSSEALLGDAPPISLARNPLDDRNPRNNKERRDFGAKGVSSIPEISPLDPRKPGSAFQSSGRQQEPALASTEDRGRSFLEPQTFDYGHTIGGRPVIDGSDRDILSTNQTGKRPQRAPLLEDPNIKGSYGDGKDHSFPHEPDGNRRSAWQDGREGRSLGRQGPSGIPDRDDSTNRGGFFGPPGHNGRFDPHSRVGRDGPPGRDGSFETPDDSGPPIGDGPFGFPCRDDPHGPDGQFCPPGRGGRLGQSGRDGPLGKPAREASFGPPGRDGSFGPPGHDGSFGPHGRDGAFGPPGRDRPFGQSGRDGSMGRDGPFGPSGRDSHLGRGGKFGPSRWDGPPSRDGSFGPPDHDVLPGRDGPLGHDGLPGRDNTFAQHGGDGSFAPRGRDGGRGRGRGRGFAPLGYDGPDKHFSPIQRDGPPISEVAFSNPNRDIPHMEDYEGPFGRREPSGHNAPGGPADLEGYLEPSRQDSQRGPPARNTLLENPDHENPFMERPRDNFPGSRRDHRYRDNESGFRDQLSYDGPFGTEDRPDFNPRQDHERMHPGSFHDMYNMEGPREIRDHNRRQFNKDHIPPRSGSRVLLETPPGNGNEHGQGNHRNHFDDRQHNDGRFDVSSRESQRFDSRSFDDRRRNLDDGRGTRGFRGRGHGDDSRHFSDRAQMDRDRDRRPYDRVTPDTNDGNDYKFRDESRDRSYDKDPDRNDSSSIRDRNERPDRERRTSRYRPNSSKNKDTDVVDDATKGTKHSMEVDNTCCTALLDNIPVETTYKDIRRLFSSLEHHKDGIKIINDEEGKRIGKAYVRFATNESLKKALQQDRSKMGNKLVAIKPVSKNEFDSAIDSYFPPADTDGKDYSKDIDVCNSLSATLRVLKGEPILPEMTANKSKNSQNNERKNSQNNERKNSEDQHDNNSSENIRDPNKRYLWLKNIPRNIKVSEIRGLFDGLGSVRSVQVCHDAVDKPTGEGFVEFLSHDDATKGLAKDKTFVGSNKIVVELVSKADMVEHMRLLRVAVHPEQPSSQAVFYFVKASNLPKNVSTGDIMNFFSGFMPAPESIRLNIGDGVESDDSSTALVGFHNREDAETAISANNGKKMRDKTVELAKVIV